MQHDQVLSLQHLVPPGQLYHHPLLDRIEAHIPSNCHTNHASSLIELRNGDLLCVWFAGSDEGAADIRVVMSRLSKNSARWTEPETVSNEAGKSEQNPSLFRSPSGELWLINTAMDTRGCSLQEWQRKLANGEAAGAFAMQHTSVVKRCISHDDGYTWGPSETMFAHEGSFCRQPIQILGNGRWIFGNWRSVDQHGAFGSDYTVFHLSDDEGRSWTTVEVPESNGRVHANVVELDEGKLLALFRSRSADRIYVSRSDDYGSSWSKPERTELPNNNASISAVKLASGRIAVIYNDWSAGDDPHRTVWPYERYPVTVALTEDEGRTWPYRRVVDYGDGYCGERNLRSNRRFEYPFLMQASDGLLHASYSYGTRVCIKHVCFSEEWVIGGGESRWPWSNFPVT